MALLARLKRDLYRDSVELMRLSAEIAGRPGVHHFSAMMATPANLDILRSAGLLGDELPEARPNDLLLAAEADDGATAEEALRAAESLLEHPAPGAGLSSARASGRLARARSLRGAIAARPDLNLALISVPGAYAAAEARRALRAGLHVMLFSDNVPLEQEVALKREADQRGLLCMGPDCGTALIGGVPLGFANRVRPGCIGLVGASGTGLQAVSCQIQGLGEGVSHALGSGGRDLSAGVGGRATLAALRALAADPATKVLVVICKPGEPAVEAQILSRLAQLGKPSVAHFPGRPESPVSAKGDVIWAYNLAEVGHAAVALVRGETRWETVDFAAVEAEGRAVASAAGPGTLAGLFTGGTLASEAGRLLSESMSRRGPARPRARSTSKPDVHADGQIARLNGHVIVDLGDDAFTRGKPHPIIDPAARAAAIARAVDGGACLLLLDVVLGFGAHPDPASALCETIERARELAVSRRRKLEVLASVIGTDQDPQPAGAQIVRLRGAGVRVYETPTYAAMVAAAAAAQLGK